MSIPDPHLPAPHSLDDAIALLTIRREEWRAVVGWEGVYEVSNAGRIRRVLRYRKPTGLLMPKVTRTGYLCVGLRHSGRPRQWKTLHSLVLEAFVGARPAGMEGCHWNGDKSDNRLGNLRWDTKRGNAADDKRNAVKRGVRGERAKNAKLWPEAVRVIRAEPECFGSKKMLAGAFGVSQSTITLVQQRRHWGHVPQFL